MPQPLSNVAALVSLAATEPDRLAINDGTRVVTYGELVAWAAAIADDIIDCDPLGTAPVPVLVDRSAASVAGMFGVMLAGRGLSMLNASEPSEHVGRRIERLGATIVIDATADAGWQSAGTCTTVRAADAGRSKPTIIAVDPDAVASVLFTSGSTGEPKGVVYPTSSTNRIFARRAEERLTEPDDIIAVIAPLSWAVGVVGVLHQVPLGQQIVMTDPAQLTPHALADWIDHHQFQRLTVTPTLAAMFAQNLTKGRRLESIRNVRTVGEGISWSDIDLVRSVVSRDAVIRVTYGASEGSASLNFEIPPDMPLGVGPVPLGHPNRPNHITLEPISDEPGAPNEIVFHACYAREYWGDPTLTAEKFGMGEDGLPTWRSGDLATIDQNGLWMHRGRADLLVKIRGKLVEPAEPERVLSNIPWVRRAVVMPHTLPAGATRLVAHIEAVDGADADTEHLRRALNEQLPSHLVPSVFVRHDALPQMAGGKVDRQSLLAEPLVPWRSRSLRAPSGEIETVVTRIVADVLGIGPVWPDDNLWELGCDSLAAVEIVTALADAGFTQVELEDLLTAETPAAIAARIQLSKRSAPTGPIVALNAAGTRPPLWVIAGAGGSALAFRALAAQLGDDQPVHVIEANAIHRRGTIDRSVEAAAARFRELVLTQTSGPYLLAGHSAGGLVAFELAQQLDSAGHDVKAIVIDSAPSAAGLAMDSNEASLAAEVDNWATLSFAKKLKRVIRERYNGDMARLRVAATLRGWRSRSLAQRYRVFFDIQRRFFGSYVVRPAAFPVVVIEQRGGLCGQAWAQFAPHIETHFVDGGHTEMLQPPFIDAVAEIIGGELQRR